MFTEFNNRKYDVDTSNCECGSSKIEYDVEQEVHEKHWGQGRKCELIEDQWIAGAHCPDCEVEFPVRELTSKPLEV